MPPCCVTAEASMALSNAERQKRRRDRRNALAAKAEGPTWKQSAGMAIQTEYAKIIREVMNVPPGTCDTDLQMGLGRRIAWADIVRLVKPAFPAQHLDQFSRPALPSTRFCAT